MSIYPAWRYHKTLMPEGKIIHSEEEFKALGAGWVDTPAKFEVETMSQAEAEKAIESGEAEITHDAVVEATEPKRRGRHRKA